MVKNEIKIRKSVYQHIQIPKENLHGSENRSNGYIVL